MEIKFDMEDNNVLYDVMDGIFVAMLKRQLKDSKEYLGTAYNEEDKRNNQATGRNSLLNRSKVKR
jgi:hypothetical protein